MTTTHVVLELSASGARPRTSDSVSAQRLAAQRAIALCATHAEAPPTGWNRDADSVPVPNEGFCWSIAHKHAVAVVAISTGAVGVDVERVVPRRDDLLDAIASRAEWQIVGRPVARPQIVGPRTWPAAYRIWTAKEAVLKAVGIGMAGLDKCEIVECPDDLTTRVSYCGESWIVRHNYVDGSGGEIVVAVASGDDAIAWHLSDNSDWKQERHGVDDFVVSRGLKPAARGAGAESKNVAGVLAPLLDKGGLGEVPVRSNNPPQSPLGEGGSKSVNLARGGTGARFTRASNAP